MNKYIPAIFYFIIEHGLNVSNMVICVYFDSRAERRFLNKMKLAN